MAAKVAFDYAARLIRPAISPDGNGVIALDTQVDLYSDGKEDWLADSNLHKFRFPVRAIGGQSVSSGKLGTTYLLTDGWRVDPTLSGNTTIATTPTGVATVLGGTGTDEAVRQGFQLTHAGYIREGFLTVRRVGAPTDDLSIEVKDAAATVYESVKIPGGAMDATFNEEFFGSELELIAPKDTPLYFEFTRTGARDTNNYYELALGADVYALGEAESSDSGVWSSLSGDLVMRYRTEVPYQLQINGNLFTDTGLPVAVPSSSVNVQQTVSTLVEIRDSGASSALIQAVGDLETEVDQFGVINSGLATDVSDLTAVNQGLATNVGDLETEVSGLAATNASLVTDIGTLETEVSTLVTTNDALVLEVTALGNSQDLGNIDLALLRKILTNRKITDPNTGIITIYDDDNTVLMSAQIWEDSAGTIPYKGQGVERQDKLA